MPRLQLLSPELDGSHAFLASSRVVVGYSRVTGILLEVRVEVVCLKKPGFPARPTEESDTVVVLQAELLVSDQSGWEQGVLPDPEHFHRPKLVYTQSLIEEEWSLLLEGRNIGAILLLTLWQES